MNLSSPAGVNPLLGFFFCFFFFLFVIGKLFRKWLHL